jgi:mannose-6-phosphate isomerase-like protein (cupin superfamily)
VLEVGQRYASSRSTTWIEITDRSDGKLSFERGYAPNTGRADPHYHLDFSQAWEALEGAGEMEVDGERRSLRKGDRVVLEPGTPHRDPYLPGEGELRIRGSFDPCTPFIESFAEAWAHHLREGTVDDQDQIPLIQILVIAEETGAQSYRAGVPRRLQRATLPLAAGFGRLRGYKPSYD